MHPSSLATELAAVLQLIASGSGDDKLRYIAANDPDWFVDHVLAVDYVDRDETAPTQGRMDRAMLDAAIAKIALRAAAFDAIDDELRAAG